MKKESRPIGWDSFFMAEGVKRKLNVVSPSLDNLELVEFAPPKQSFNQLYPFDDAGARLTKVEPKSIYKSY